MKVGVHREEEMMIPESRSQGHQEGARIPMKGLSKRPPHDPGGRGHQPGAGTQEEEPRAGAGSMVWASRGDGDRRGKT